MGATHQYGDGARSLASQPTGCFAGREPDASRGVFSVAGASGNDKRPPWDSYSSMLPGVDGPLWTCTTPPAASSEYSAIVYEPGVMKRWACRGKKRSRSASQPRHTSHIATRNTRRIRHADSWRTHNRRNLERVLVVAKMHTLRYTAYKE